MSIAGVITLLNNVDIMSKITMKIDTATAEYVNKGKGQKMILDDYAKDEMDFRTNFFQDELGQLKYSVITGKILDYKA